MPDFTTFSVLFFTRKLNRNKKELSIYARITVNGKCAEMSLKRKTSVNEWDNSKGRLKRTSTRIKILNSYLNPQNEEGLMVSVMYDGRNVIPENN